MTRDALLGWMQEHLDGRPDLLEQVMPAYPALGKRVLQDNGSWFACLKRPNVALVRTPIERITRDGIRTTDGRLHGVDAICYATGFHANQFVAFDMHGRDGASLHETWGEEPGAYLGITVPKFPNLFLCYGPGTNLAHSAGLFFHAEFQTMHAMDAIHPRTAPGRAHDRGARGGPRPLRRRTRRGDLVDGLGAPEHPAQPLQEPEGPDLHAVAVADGRVLGDDPRGRSGGLPDRRVAHRPLPEGREARSHPARAARRPSPSNNRAARRRRLRWRRPVAGPGSGSSSASGPSAGTGSRAS